MNPNNEVFERFVWNDLNGDLFFQPGETGRLLSRGGGLSTRIDPDMKRPYTDEVTFSFDHEVMRDLRLSAAFVYREERERFGSQNVGVPDSAYSPVTVVDPGRDGLLSTADDNPNFVVFNQDRATLGQDLFLITNDPLFDSHYRGFEVTATKRLSDKWQMIAGYTIGEALVEGPTSIQGPNSLINSRGPEPDDSTDMFKLTGTYELPRGVLVAGNFRTQTGKPVTRQARFALNQGQVLVNVEPFGGERMERLTTVDVRLTKAFEFGPNRRLQVHVSGYNLTNSNVVWGVRSLTGRLNVREGGAPDGQVFNQQQYFSPTQVLAPRIFQFGAAFSF
jgi:hypothetical protein